MALSDIVDVQVSVGSVVVSRAGFGVPLVLSAHQLFSDRVRSYATPDDLLADGFITSGPEYKAASGLFAQRPSPAKLLVGKLLNRPTMTWTITPTVANARQYVVTVGGIEYVYTSDGPASAAEICAALTSAINAGTATHGVTATDATPDVTLACAAGAWQSVVVGDIALLALAQTTPDPGLAADLAAISLANDDWWALVNPFASKACHLICAAWIETKRKFFLAATQDTQAPLVVEGDATDIAKAVKAAAYARTKVAYHPDNGQFMDARWLGKLLPEDPGSETWELKTLAGLTPVRLSPTQVTNLEAKLCGRYETVAGVNVTLTNQVGANEHIDVIRFRDWLEARIAEGVFGRLASVKKVPFTDMGITLIEGEIRAVLDEGVRVGGLSSDPGSEYAVFMPKAKSVSTANKGARLLPDCKFEATLAGAIHRVRVRGVVSV